MPRYIDADLLFYKMLKTKDGLQEAAARTDDHQEAWMAEGMQAFLSDLNHYPTADVAPVVHGKWEQDDYGFYCCSKCYYEWDESEYKTPFCPNCGAKMDLED